jgi:MFS family permease
MLATVFGIYIKTAGMTESVVGDVEATVAFAAAIVALLGTPLIAAVGYRALMVLALVLMVASRVGMAAYPAVAVLIGLSLTVGLGDGFLRAIGSAFMAQNSGSKERSHLFSIEFLARVSAAFLGGIAGGLIPTLLGNWTTELASLQWTIVIGSVFVGAGILPMLSLKEDGHEKTRVVKAYKDSFAGLKQWRHLSKLIGPQAAIALGGGMVLPFVPLYLKTSLGASIGQIGAILAFSSVVTAIGAFGTPIIARKLGLPTGVALMQGLSVPFLAVVSLATSLPLAIGALWVRGALMSMAGPLYNQLSMEGLTDKQKPVVAGWMFFALNMMWLVGNVVGGRLMEISYALPYVVAVVLYSTGASLTYYFWRSHGKPERAGAPSRIGGLAPEAA